MIPHGTISRKEGLRRGSVLRLRRRPLPILLLKTAAATFAAIYVISSSLRAVLLVSRGRPPSVPVPVADGGREGSIQGGGPPISRADPERGESDGRPPSLRSRKINWNSVADHWGGVEVGRSVAYEFRPKSVNAISILGERNSGTNWLYNHISGCFNHSLPVRFFSLDAAGGPGWARCGASD